MYQFIHRTDYLLPKRSFWKGFSSVFNLSGGNTSEFNSSSSSAEADYKAIKSDWDMIGQDFKKALKQIGK